MDPIINPLFAALTDDDDDLDTPPATPPAETPPATPPADPPAVTPDPIPPVETPPATNPAMLAFQMSQSTKRLNSELKAEFGDLLEESEIDEIANHIAASSQPESFIAQVAQGVHKEYAKTIAFDKLRSRQSQGVTDPVPVGSQAPVRVGAEPSNALMTDFERMYGKPSRQQRERLSKEQR